jgi:hypothetical protein
MVQEKHLRETSSLLPYNLDKALGPCPRPEFGLSVPLVLVKVCIETLLTCKYQASLSTNLGSALGSAFKGAQIRWEQIRQWQPSV